MRPENIYPTPEDHGHGQAPPEHHITGLDVGVSHQPAPQPMSRSELTQNPTVVQATAPAWPAAAPDSASALPAPSDDKRYLY